MPLGAHRGNESLHSRSIVERFREVGTVASAAFLAAILVGDRYALSQSITQVQSLPTAGERLTDEPQDDGQKKKEEQKEKETDAMWLERIGRVLSTLEEKIGIPEGTPRLSARLQSLIQDYRFLPKAEHRLAGAKGSTEYHLTAVTEAFERGETDRRKLFELYERIAEAITGNEEQLRILQEVNTIRERGGTLQLDGKEITAEVDEHYIFRRFEIDGHTFNLRSFVHGREHLPMAQSCLRLRAMAERMGVEQKEFSVTELDRAEWEMDRDGGKLRGVVTPHGVGESIKIASEADITAWREAVKRLHEKESAVREQEEKVQTGAASGKERDVRHALVLNEYDTITEEMLTEEGRGTLRTLRTLLKEVERARGQADALGERCWNYYTERTPDGEAGTMRDRVEPGSVYTTSEPIKFNFNLLVERTVEWGQGGAESFEASERLSLTEGKPDERTKWHEVDGQRLRTVTAYDHRTGEPRKVETFDGKHRTREQRFTAEEVIDVTYDTEGHLVMEERSSLTEQTPEGKPLPLVTKVYRETQKNPSPTTILYDKKGKPYGLALSVLSPEACERVQELVKERQDLLNKFSAFKLSRHAFARATRPIDTELHALAQPYYRLLAGDLDSKDRWGRYTEALWKYTHDSPDSRRPYLPGFDTWHGQYVQSTAETAFARPPSVFECIEGDCDDLAVHTANVFNAQEGRNVFPAHPIHISHHALAIRISRLQSGRHIGESGCTFGYDVQGGRKLPDDSFEGFETPEQAFNALMIKYLGGDEKSLPEGSAYAIQPGQGIDVFYEVPGRPPIRYLSPFEVLLDRALSDRVCTLAYLERDYGEAETVQEERQALARYLEACEQAAMEYPQLPVLRIQAGLACLYAENDARAMEHLKGAAEAHPHQPQVRMGMMVVHARNGKREEAEKVFQELFTLYREQIPELIQLAEFCEQAKLAEKLASVAESLCALQPDNEALLSWLGVIELERGNPEKAAELQAEVLRENLYCYPAYQRLGEASLRLGKTEDALWFYTEASKDAPASPSVMRGLGLSYFLYGEGNAAAEKLREHVAFDPDRPLFNQETFMNKATWTKERLQALQELLTKEHASTEEEEQKQQWSAALELVEKTVGSR